MSPNKKTPKDQPKGVPIKGGLVKRLMQFYLLPELQKKEFHKMQLIFKPDEVKPKILFDEETKEVKFWVKPLDASIERKEGDPVYLDEITGETKTRN
jgi:hypothetical protein